MNWFTQWSNESGVIKEDMKASELRIGNWIAQDMLDPLNLPNTVEILVVVGPIEIRDAAHYGDNWTGKPIPLTSEWLERFGFYKSNDPYGGFLKKLSNYAEIRLREANEGYTWYSHLNEVRIPYVHTLQNLWFVLEGTELTIKEKI